MKRKKSANPTRPKIREERTKAGMLLKKESTVDPTGKTGKESMNTLLRSNEHALNICPNAQI